MFKGRHFWTIWVTRHQHVGRKSSWSCWRMLPSILRAAHPFLEKSCNTSWSSFVCIRALRNSILLWLLQNAAVHLLSKLNKAWKGADSNKRKSFLWKVKRYYMTLFYSWHWPRAVNGSTFVFVFLKKVQTLHCQYLYWHQGSKAAGGASFILLERSFSGQVPFISPKKININVLVVKFFFNRLFWGIILDRQKSYKASRIPLCHPPAPLPYTNSSSFP